jgi:UDP-2-acetamido-3-amino-2,3-dideoxy-glucuronate N-acetyltransferase
MKKNIAVVGCGYWGKNLVRNYFELGALSSICDPNHLIASTFAKKYNVKSCSFAEILDDPNIKGVVLAVPAKLHASMSVDAMNKGKHVFVEKPLAMNEVEAKLMIETANNNNVQLMVGHLLHYHPIFKEIKSIVENGQIGKLEYIQSNRMSFGKYRSEEDVIWSFAPHDISMILTLANEKPNIVKYNAKSIIKENHADIANIFMEFPSGLKSNISVSWINPNKEVKLILTGSLAMLIFNDTKPWDEKLSFYSYDVKKTDNLININKSSLKFVAVPEEEPLKNECKHFIKVVNQNVQPLTDGVQGLNVIKILNMVSKLRKIVL